MKTYEASFKKRGSGKLIWVAGEFENEKEATEGLKAYMTHHYPTQKYLLYGGPLEKKK